MQIFIPDKSTRQSNTKPKGGILFIVHKSVINTQLDNWYGMGPTLWACSTTHGARVQSSTCWIVALALCQIGSATPSTITLPIYLHVLQIRPSCLLAPDWAPSLCPNTHMLQTGPSCPTHAGLDSTAHPQLHILSIWPCHLSPMHANGALSHTPVHVGRMLHAGPCHLTHRAWKFRGGGAVVV